MSNTYDTKNSLKYSCRDFSTTDYLAFRDLPNIIGAKNKNHYALDYGCGAGRSTRFLKEIGYKSIGIDTNWNMLFNARLSDPAGLYIQIKSSEAPISDSSVDLIFSSFVLMEVPTQKEILRILREFKRMLKTGGKAVIIVNTVYFYEGRWTSCDINFPENRGNLRSGQKIRVRLIPENIILSDYFWNDNDYKVLFESAGLKIFDELMPLGIQDDNIAWIDEFSIPPHVVYILS